MGITTGRKHVVKAVQIGAQHVIPLGIFHGGKGVIAGDAGVQHHAIISAVGGHIGFQSRAAAVAVGDVEADQPTNGPGMADILQGGLTSGFVGMVMHDNAKAVAGEAEGDGAADALAGTCHQDGSVQDHEPMDWLERMPLASSGW